VDELVFALIATRPEFAHAKSCRKSLVGPMRRFLVRHDGKELAAMSGLPPHAARLIEQRIAAGAVLADFCARCGRCDEARILK
jgi:hypothetical protein